MKQSRTRLSLAIVSGILPLFFMLALIVPLWIFFTGERYFLSTLLHFAEVPLTDNPAQAPGMARRLLLLALLYLPAGLFAFAIWQGMKVTRSVRQRSVLSLSWRTARSLHRSGHGGHGDPVAGVPLSDPAARLVAAALLSGGVSAQRRGAASDRKLAVCDISRHAPRDPC